LEIGSAFRLLEWRAWPWVGERHAKGKIRRRE
jgi:hypothetical protein